MKRKGRKSDVDEARGKLLDAWVPDEHSGGPLGCLSTTFTFDAAFFEEYCLGSFLQIETTPEESGAAYLIEREEKLRQSYVGVIADAAHAADVRSLSWDVLPVRVPGSCMHAKVSLLAFASHVRLMVASANLTDAAYRSNLEGFCTFDFRDDDGDDPQLLQDALDFLDTLTAMSAAEHARARAQAFLATVRKKAARFPTVRRKDGVQTTFVVNGAFPDERGGKRSALRTLREVAWRSPRPPRECAVVSPFFDADPGETVAATEAILAQRGETKLAFHLACSRDAGGALVVQAPAALAKAAPRADLFALKLEDETESRALHAKMLWLESDAAVALMVGSSNFTRAGLGVGSGPFNIEANVAFFGNSGSDAALRLAKAFPASEDEAIDTAAARFEPAFDGAVAQAGESALAPPAGFQSATWVVDDAGSRVVVDVDPEQLPESWVISKDASGSMLLCDARSRDLRDEANIIIPWPETMPPSVLYVFWTSAGAPRSAALPVNVTDPAALPMPDQLRALSLESLLSVLTMAKPTHEAIALAAAQQARAAAAQASADLDPLRRVSSEAFLLNRTKRFTHAVEALRDRLEQPTYSESMLFWRVHGPVGPVALQKAVELEASSDGEKCFLLAEIALALSRIEPRDAPGVLARKVVKSELSTVIRVLYGTVAPRLAGLPGDLRGYLEDAFAVALGGAPASDSAAGAAA